MSKPRTILEVKKDQIDENLLALVAHVKKALEQSVACLESRDEAACNLIIENDSQVNDYRRLIEHECFTAIALHQPVAHDLREIITATRLADELERMADYASDIAAIVMQMNEVSLSGLGMENVKVMGSLSARMLDEVLAAYLDKDAKKARKAAELDDQLDAEQAKLIETLFGVMQSNPVTVPNASRILWISHNLERCGDRATNIAEHVVFMLEAEVVELD
jgi:phosphate transport system protein